jgi:hypothetical protein
MVITNIKGVIIMSPEEEETLMENFDKGDVKHAKQDFLHRMERKLSRKEHQLRS